MSDQQLRDMVIRHDQQLVGFPELVLAVNRLTTELAVNNARRLWMTTAMNALGSIAGCLGTWFIMVHIR